MTATLLNAENAVLLVLDVQERLAAAMDRRDEVRETAAFLAAVAGIVGVPVVVTRQYPAGLGDVEPELAARLTELEAEGLTVARADKMAFDCFREPTFRDAVEAMERRQLIIVGMESHICVTQTAISALAAGWDVHVVEDGCCSRSGQNHQGAMDRMRAAGAVITCAESAAYELVGEAGTPHFKALLGLVKQRG